MALRLRDGQRENIRAALVALGPERRALLAGKCFNHRAHPHRYNYTDADGDCAVGVMTGYWANPIYGARKEAGIATGTPAYAGLWDIAELNDAGRLRTRRAVAELLALADDAP